MVSTRVVIAAAAALSLAFAGCSNGQDHASMDGTNTMPPAMDHGPGTSTPDPAMAHGTAVPIPEGAEYNGPDVAFAQEMIVHHAQAIEMADLALARAVDPRVKDLATHIKMAQGPEIDQLRGWLQRWGQPAPDPARPQTMEMPSMITGDDMRRLHDATGPAFDRLFLEQMIRHHEGAVTMAGMQEIEGRYPPAIAMARMIVETQSAEIGEMRSILG
jgi:uncharacterized protein (DUF305 family)